MFHKLGTQQPAKETGVEVILFHNLLSVPVTTARHVWMNSCRDLRAQVGRATPFLFVGLRYKF